MDSKVCVIYSVMNLCDYDIVCTLQSNARKQIKIQRLSEETRKEPSY